VSCRYSSQRTYTSSFHIHMIQLDSFWVLISVSPVSIRYAEVDPGRMLHVTTSEEKARKQMNQRQRVTASYKPLL
jgi:hypothetical protein